MIGGWLRALADSGRLDEELTAIAVDGKPDFYQISAHPPVIAPDGTWLVTTGADGTVRIWDPATGQQTGRRASPAIQVGLDRRQQP